MEASSSIRANKCLKYERIRRNWYQREVADQVGATVITVRRWEQGSQQPNAYFRMKLCALFGKTPEELGLIPEELQPSTSVHTEVSVSEENPFTTSLRSLPCLWGISYPRNPFFTGRREILHSLHEKLTDEYTMGFTQSWAITGFGGIGKTQIALEYAYQYRAEYHYIFWVSAATRETLLSGLMVIAELLQLPEKDQRDQNRVIQAIKHWLTTHQEWLLILDNVEDVTIMLDIVPMEHPGHLLLTTRAQVPGSLAQSFEVKTMGVVEGVLFLLRRAELIASDAFLDQLVEVDLAAAEALANEMDFLPLALEQAGAYIDEVGCSLASYLELYRTHSTKFLQRQSCLPITDLYSFKNK